MTTSSASLSKTTIHYDDRLVRQFMIASIIWGLVGMSVGLLVAYQLNFPKLNMGLPWFGFGRLRPLHTNGAIFAFVGNMIFAGVYHSTQRLCKCRTASDLLGQVHFWGWQLIILGAALTLPFGFTQGKEYAELIWPIDLAVVVIWVVFAINFFWTLAKRNEPTLYVAIWFYIATIVTVAMLYIVNNLHVPSGLLHSYPVFGGVQDALVQWWYGHNAVAFFLTTPILGIMYYYVPKAANRPVYSYRLSVVHFWSLVFIYIWAGPHHLLNTALPMWLQILGMIFSLMLWAPSWGGMLNGLLTLRGAWDKLRSDPVLKFFAAGVGFYGMATFEGPLMSIRAVNYLSHYTDWTIGHVHEGTLGWNGFMAAGMFYFLAPRLWKKPLYSVKMANAHFWIGFVGILFYVAAMWASGITQGLMLNSTNAEGTALAYPTFLETVQSIRPLMLFRAIGGSLYLAGWIMLMVNIFLTIKGAEVVDGQVEVYTEEKEATRKVEGSIGVFGTLINAPVAYSALLTIGSTMWMLAPGIFGMFGFFIAAVTVMVAVVHYRKMPAAFGAWYEKLLGNWAPFTALALLAAAVGGAVQIIPTVLLHKADNLEGRIQVPYTPLELAGRDIYISEGCYNCHSQMIRTIVPDVLRYGEYSHLGESIYDHPFQWGSKRTGPDLAREGGPIVPGAELMRGGVRSNSWHYLHMMDPETVSKGSIMPPYPWLKEQKADWDAVLPRINVLQVLGVPYPEYSEGQVAALLKMQADEIVANLESENLLVEPDSKLVALIAYLQKLGVSEDSADAVARREEAASATE
jgi:cytochrome c oxidase cbb3-type subunit I/II